MALWLQVRNRRLANFKFRTQWSLGPFVADFCCIEARLVVEVDGGQHCEAIDAGRTAWLKAQGFRVIRFWNNDVLTNMDGVLVTILEALRKATGREEGKDPHPALSRKRERGDD